MGRCGLLEIMDSSNTEPSVRIPRTCSAIARVRFVIWNLNKYPRFMHRPLSHFISLEVSLLIHSSAQKGKCNFLPIYRSHHDGTVILENISWQRKRAQGYILSRIYSSVYVFLLFIVKSSLKSDIFFLRKWNKCKANMLSIVSIFLLPHLQQKQKPKHLMILPGFRISAQNPSQFRCSDWAIQHFLKRVPNLQTLRIAWWLCLNRLSFEYSPPLHK